MMIFLLSDDIMYGYIIVSIRLASTQTTYEKRYDYIETLTVALRQ